MHRRTALGALGLAAVLPLVGCSDEPEEKQSTPQEEVAAAKRTLDGAKFVKLTMTSTDVPPSANGVTGANGVGAISASEPKFKGTITGSIKGVTGTIDLVTIGDDAWMKFFTATHVKTDLKALGAPNPSSFFHPEVGLSSILTSTTGLAETKKIRQGEAILRQFAGKVPGRKIVDIFNTGDASKTFDVVYGITAEHQLRVASITGPFFPGATSTYRAVLEDYGTAVEITQPS